MGIGPIQLLIVFAFNHLCFRRDITAELERLHNEDTVRVIDALTVYKDPDGQIELQQLSVPSKDQTVQASHTISAVIGLKAKGDEGAVAAPHRVKVFSDETSWDALEELPNDSAAALVLLQHHWALRLHDAIASAGCFCINDGFIVSPLDIEAGAGRG